MLKSGGGFSGFSDVLRSGGDLGVDFQIPHNFLIRNPPKIVQIGGLGARIRPFYDPGFFLVSKIEVFIKFRGRIFSDVYN